MNFYEAFLIYYLLGEITMTEVTSRLSFSFDKALKDQLLILAKDENRSLSSYIRLVLINHTKSAVDDEIAARATIRAKKLIRRKNRKNKGN